MEKESSTLSIGFEPETNTVYEFWRAITIIGNPEKFPKSEQINYTKRKDYGTTLQRNSRKNNSLKRSSGYKIEYVWESEWKILSKENKQSKQKERVE